MGGELGGIGLVDLFEHFGGFVCIAGRENRHRRADFRARREDCRPQIVGRLIVEFFCVREFASLERRVGVLQERDAREGRPAVCLGEVFELLGILRFEVRVFNRLRRVGFVHFPALNADYQRERDDEGRDYKVAVSFPVKPHSVFEFDPFEVFVENHGFAFVGRGGVGQFRIGGQGGLVFRRVYRAFSEKFVVHKLSIS